MTEYLSRSAWGARASRGSTPLVASEVDGIVLHWPGMAKPIHSYDGVASALRGWQDYHMDVRGWSDIAYQVAVDQAGRAWTLRGLRTRSGANGDADVNRRYGALLLILAPGEQPTDAMKATARGVIADFRKIYPNGTAIKPHSAVRPAGTDCPGDAARAAISRGDFTPRTTIPEVDDMAGEGPEILSELRAFATAEANRYSDMRSFLTSFDQQEDARYQRFEQVVSDLNADHVKLSGALDQLAVAVSNLTALLQEHAAPKA